MPPSSTRAQAVLLLYGACMLYLVPVFPHFLSANELTRWASAAGTVEHGSLAVTWAEPIIGPPMDVAPYRGLMYSNKAPALTVLSVPPYLATRAILGPPTRANLRWSLYLVRVLTVTLAGVVLGLLLYRSCHQDAFALATLLFGTSVFLYGALYFSHVLAAACLYGGYVLVLRRPQQVISVRRHLLAGAVAMVAATADYQVALGVVVMAGALMFLPGGLRRTMLLAAGGAPIAALLAVYNYALFGSPFALSVMHGAFPNLANERASGVAGFSWPSLSQLAALLASPSRGLLFYSPVLVLGLVALIPRRREPAAWFRLSFVVALVLAMAGYQYSHGGWGMGSRYLIAALPFLVEAAHDRGVGAGFLASACLAYSVVLCVTPALSFPFAPEFIPFPHASLIRPFLAAGFATPNWGYPLIPGVVSLVPVVAAAGAALALGCATGWRSVIGGLAGLLLALAIVAAPVRDTASEASFRALVLDTSFSPADRLGSLMRASADPTERAQLQRLRETVAATRAVGPDDWPYRRASGPSR